MPLSQSAGMFHMSPGSFRTARCGQTAVLLLAFLAALIALSACGGEQPAPLAATPEQNQPTEATFPAPTVATKALATRAETTPSPTQSPVSEVPSGATPVSTLPPTTTTTPKPTAVPEPVSTPKPSPTPTPTVTATKATEPTATPFPTAAPTSTAIPTSTPEPTSTATPMPTPTHRPTPTPFSDSHSSPRPQPAILRGETVRFRVDQ